MCGIFAVLSDGEGKGPDLGALTDSVDALSRYSLKEAASGKAAKAMGEVRSRCALWVRPEACLGASGIQDLGPRLEKSLKTLEDWVAGLEAGLGTKGLGQKGRESVHALVTAGHDTVWQLREDFLANFPKVRELLGGGGKHDARELGHGWALNLVLNSIDRLEVRGRDSAGVAVYARFASKADLDKFLKSDLLKEFEERSKLSSFTHSGVVRPKGSPETLLFAFKVAEEVGEMGQNVRFLRKAVAGDSLFQSAIRRPGVRIQALGHTRWASNGIISVPNCHPVDSTLLKAGRAAPDTRGALVAALNGDIDNFQELHKKYVAGRRAGVETGITTDAKIIPIVVQAHLEKSSSLEEAFRKAFDEFEGSMAICLMSAERPGELICAQKGSGQGLFLGFAGETVAAASEMYGLVELTSSYLKAEGEKETDGRLVGETFLVRTPRRGGVLLLPGGAPDKARIKTAEITTRDINRGDYPRFLLKEISESVLSVERTLRGKVAGKPGKGEPFILLDEAVLPREVVTGLMKGRITRIIPIGQGTAAVAAEGVGHLLDSALKKASMKVEPMKATELSSHFMREDMSDSLVVAVSQSGTTTDTNRTVDMARERGASVLAIVNRRNSDLVYKANGVLYTSDGRDIEMSVASTKAFYAQIVAGHILALGLAESLGALDRDELARRVGALLELPGAMRRVLELSPVVREIADKTALSRRYWAIVGTGASKIAADEIRIKLSELCYKAIAVDYLEDKKHIDLSSEPLIIVCASGLPAVAVSDVVKEVAIFKAHESLPVVFTEENETRFDPYTRHRVPLPAYGGELGFLLPTMAGHLFGYHAARAFDRKADEMRRLRTVLVKEMEAGGEDLSGTDVWHLLGRSGEIASGALEVQAAMDSGAVDSGIEVRTATKLSSLIDFLLGRVPLDMFFPRFQRPGTVESLLACLVQHLSDGVNELCRPIDAIKHQAKTVTVGISRQVERPAEGILWSVLRELGADASRVTARHSNLLTKLEPLLARVAGATLYKVQGLTRIGKPVGASKLKAERKIGCAADIPSRCDKLRKLTGTKWGVVADSRSFLGRGAADQRPILIVPAVGQRPSGELLLFHIEFAENGPRDRRMSALKALQDRYKQLLIAVTEATDREWDPSMIDGLSNEELFFEEPRAVASLIAKRLKSPSA